MIALVSYTNLRLDRGTLCMALFIICIPVPEMPPTSMAVRPIVYFAVYFT